ncbi:SagB/ThcOx family dehydrogenase [Pseudomonas silvicola]|nr:SagB/ThcOx family dehydrogenase [Pseudomonas silvicola]
MHNIPHEHFLKSCDPQVLDETLAFHALGNYCLHPATSNLTILHGIDHSTLTLLSGKELRYDLLQENTLNSENLGPLPPNSPLNRDRSCDRFTDDPISFPTVKGLLSALTTASAEGHHRLYPSGGALYPVDVFCCRLGPGNDRWPSESDILHLLPASRKLEIIVATQPDDYLKEALLGQSFIGTPYLALIYVAFLPKTLFKYRYRGYRLALMEVGSMYMLVDLQCRALGLKNRVWSGYTDHMVSNALSINPGLAVPLCVQFVGY